MSCTVHLPQIDQLAISLLQCISEASSLFLPTVRPSRRHCIPGWNDHVREFKLKADFWYRVWTEAGSPKSDVLFQIKKHVKSRYKYQIRKLKRREEYIKNQKLLSTFFKSSTKQFWKEVKHIRNSGNIASAASVIDGVSDPELVSNCLSSKFSVTLNSHNNDTFDESCLHISESDVDSFEFTVDCLLEAFSHLKSKKSDGSDLNSSHFIMALPVIDEFLCSLFTIITRHGHLPSCLRDCILVPVLKPGKDSSCGDSYRPIALASTLSKILEWCILLKFNNYLQTSELQFGFKPGLSTTFCTGVLKGVVSHYLQRGSSVFTCFLNASKAFDLVRHSLLFKKLLSVGLPDLVVRLLSRWYSSQQLNVHWGKAYSNKFGVSNGVRQGGVLSPILFSIILTHY